MRLFMTIIYLLCLPIMIFSATFSDPMTPITDFGVINNLNTSLQPSSSYTSTSSGQTLRTNNFQSLQLNFGGYAVGRLPCRMGAFTVSNSAEGIFGPRLEVSGYFLAGDQAAGIPPNQFLAITQNPQNVTFGFDGVLDPDLLTNLDSSFSKEVLTVLYLESLGAGMMTDYNISMDAYHTVQYQDLKPKLTFGSGILGGITIDNIPTIIPVSGSSLVLTPGTKFLLTFVNPVGVPEIVQDWLFYVQTKDAPVLVEWTMTYDVVPAPFIPGGLGLANVVLTATAPLEDSYIRTAVIQTDDPFAVLNILNEQTPPKWQLATANQVLPVTPISMFWLWPYAWTKSVGPQLTENQERNVYTSSCTTNSLLIPLLARSDFNAANCWYNQLVDREGRGENVFDLSTNSFVTLVNMLIANYYDADIAAFQGALALSPASTPNAPIMPNASALEAMFDTYRGVVPTNVEWETDIVTGAPQAVFPMIDVLSLLPSGGGTRPLAVFPGYLSVNANNPPIAGAVNQDSIKGNICYAETNNAEVPPDFALTFNLAKVSKTTCPFGFLTGDFSSGLNMVPPDFWTRISNIEQLSIQIQLNKFLASPLPGLETYVEDQGKALFQLALSAQYAFYVLMAQQGILPPYNNPLPIVIPPSVQAAVQPIVQRIQDLLVAWLITGQFGSTALTNYLMVDQEASLEYRGIVALLGTTSATGGETDGGNAVYTDHHAQYGYFLAAAAIAIDLDDMFGGTWISTLMTSSKPDSLVAPVSSHPIKQFIDMLWRDYGNPATDDDELPYYRHNYSFEGHSCGKGVPPQGAFVSRVEESISLDFQSALSLLMYADAIQLSNLSMPETQGFDLMALDAFARLSQMGLAAQGLFYNGGNWVYQGGPFDINLTAGLQADNKVDSGLNQELGEPPCRLGREGCVFSDYRVQLFCEDLVNYFQTGTGGQCSSCSD